MRFLGVFGPAGVLARLAGQVFRAVFGFDVLTRGGDGFAGHLHAVGPHIGDQAGSFAVDIHAFIQALGEAHGVLGAEAELAAGFLLQSGGGERCRRIAADALAFHRIDAESAGFDLGFGGEGELFAVQVELIQLAAIKLHQPCGERRAGGRAEHNLDGPIFARLEDLDFRFPLADQPQGDRLHPPGGAAAGQFAPEHRGEGEADEVVQRAAGQIGVD